MGGVRRDHAEAKQNEEWKRNRFHESERRDLIVLHNAETIKKYMRLSLGQDHRELSLILLSSSSVLAVVLLAARFAVTFGDVTLELSCNLGVLSGKVVFLSLVLA